MLHFVMEHFMLKIKDAFDQNHLGKDMFHMKGQECLACSNCLPQFLATWAATDHRPKDCE